MRGLLAAALLLAGCGGGEGESENVTDPTALNVIDAAANGKPAVVTAAADCSNKPDFVPIYDDARITTCISGEDGLPRHVSGNIVYVTAADPAKVLGWSRAQANASGLGQVQLTPSKYEAGEKSKRSILVVVEPEGTGSRVSINWGRET
ncbi:hypothetical protein [Sphingomonas sp. M1-B02]|uniref:hypothetical protein n=1 Tax=Sphingomonas sp. M1-B02 TaxID=3114300 RepID=UPI00223F450E|nr:hypothetical protein [Sphingomonas sp. S6-11]UZK65291.1 hypothetical protein OKW87_12300 [Sphingomonas sp. S6-11]